MFFNGLTRLHTTFERGFEVTDYYLNLGHGQSYSTGTLKHKPTLPLTEDDLISGIAMTVSEEAFDYDLVVQEHVGKLEQGDTLTVSHANRAALWILDEWAEEFNVPDNQREEIWTSDGLEASHVYFENAEDEDWYWLTEAETDYIDGSPVPVYPEEEEHWEE